MLSRACRWDQTTGNCRHCIVTLGKLISNVRIIGLKKLKFWNIWGCPSPACFTPSVDYGGGEGVGKIGFFKLVLAISDFFKDQNPECPCWVKNTSTVQQWRLSRYNESALTCVGMSTDMSGCDGWIYFLNFLFNVINRFWAQTKRWHDCVCHRGCSALETFRDPPPPTRMIIFLQSWGAVTTRGPAQCGANLILWIIENTNHCNVSSELKFIHES